jgi:hypothetical protein
MTATTTRPEASNIFAATQCTPRGRMLFVAATDMAGAAQ